MRRILILFLLLIPFVGSCLNKRKGKGTPTTRWREVTRLKPDSTVVPFADTLFITFHHKDSFSYHNGNGFIYNGVFTISPDSILDFGTARYRLVGKTPEQLVLADQKGIYVLGVDLSDTAKIIRIDTEKILPVTDIDMMIGHWTVYKRTAKEAGTTINDDKVIRAIFITGPSTDGKEGFILGGKDPLSEPSWYIKDLGPGPVLDCAGKNLRTLKVIKCQGGEMILQEDDITFYFKQFK
jgi:hypothetical protein